MSAHRLDARGLLCPLPVIRTRDRIKTLATGDVLTIVASDPGTLQDIPAWCRVQGHKLLDSAQHDNSLWFRIEVGLP